MGARLDKNPGNFKTKANRAGNTVFVAPDLVTGTLERGFAFLEGLGNPFQRAVFMMFLISEVHPFTDGNGRIARIMTNAELVAGGQERIIVPTGYRIDYLTALKAVSQSSHTTPFIRMLNRAQQYTHTINWDDLETARKVLEQTGAFEEGPNAKLRIPNECKYVSR
jgi:Fic family protein